jgi:hypothetical protein
LAHILRSNMIDRAGLAFVCSGVINCAPNTGACVVDELAAPETFLAAIFECNFVRSAELAHIGDRDMIDRAGLAFVCNRVINCAANTGACVVDKFATPETFLAAIFEGNFVRSAVFAHVGDRDMTDGAEHACVALGIVDFTSVTLAQIANQTATIRAIGALIIVCDFVSAILTLVVCRDMI